MSAGSVTYNRGKARLVGGLDWVAATNIRYALLKNVAAGASEPDLNFVSEVITAGVAVEVIGPGYARGALSGKTRTEDDANNRVNFDADNVVLAAIGDNTETAQKLLVYEQVGADDTTPADDNVIALIGFPDTVLNGGQLTININDVIRAT